jgi:hypothetical protein
MATCILGQVLCGLTLDQLLALQAHKETLDPLDQQARLQRLLAQLALLEPLALLERKAHKV